MDGGVVIYSNPTFLQSSTLVNHHINFLIILSSYMMPRHKARIYEKVQNTSFNAPRIDFFPLNQFPHFSYDYFGVSKDKDFLDFQGN